MLSDRQQVREHLGRVVLVREPVVDRDAGVLRQRLHVALAEAAELDGVIHAAEHASGVLDRLLLADMAPRRAEVGHVGALVVGGDLEPDAGSGAVLLEDQGDVAAGQARDLATLELLQLQGGGQPEERLDLRRRVVAEGEEGPAEQVGLQIDGHRGLRVSGGAAAGQGPDAPCRHPGRGPPRVPSRRRAVMVHPARCGGRVGPRGRVRSASRWSRRSPSRSRGDPLRSDLARPFAIWIDWRYRTATSSSIGSLNEPRGRGPATGPAGARPSRAPGRRARPAPGAGPAPRSGW